MTSLSVLTMTCMRESIDWGRELVNLPLPIILRHTITFSLFFFLEKEEDPRPLHLDDGCIHFINYSHKTLQSHTTVRLKSPSMQHLSLLLSSWWRDADSLGLIPQTSQSSLTSKTWSPCWKYALEAIINWLLLYFLVHDNRLLSMLELYW